MYGFFIAVAAIALLTVPIRLVAVTIVKHPRQMIGKVVTCTAPEGWWA